jgi:hypothetical protein
MSWASIANNQCVSLNNLQDAVNNGVFALKNTIPVSNKEATKAEAEYYVYINPISKTNTQLVVKSNLVANTPTTSTTTSAYVPVTGLTWTTSSTATGVPSCQPSGWTISNQNLTIRYNVANSLNCGGTCNITQTGVATATITVGGVNTNLGLNFSGIGERQDANFELIKFTLNGGTYSNVQLARANAPGGGLGCAAGPVVQTYLVIPPYLLIANTVYTFKIDFTTNDNLYHVGAYYEVLLNFT